MADRPAISSCIFPRDLVCHPTLLHDECDVHMAAEMQGAYGKCATAVPLSRSALSLVQPLLAVSITRPETTVSSSVAALGTDADLDCYEEKLAEHFELEIRGRIGESCSGPNKIRSLNRCVGLTPEGLIYEADPCHVDLLTDASSLQKSNGVLTSGIKPPDADGEAAKSATDEQGHNIDEEVANN